MKASEFDKAFNDGKSVVGMLDLQKARRPGLDQRRVIGRREGRRRQGQTGDIGRIAELPYFPSLTLLAGDPSCGNDPSRGTRYGADLEAIAVKIAWAFAVASGAVVEDASKAHLARMAGLEDNPGFDLLSRHPLHGERGIEVKGRAGIGEVGLTENEWVKACNQRERYWLYVVFDCGTPHPRLLRVRDPFGKLVVKAKGALRIDGAAIFEAAEGD